jgi:hypothetical protein
MLLGVRLENKFVTSATRHLEESGSSPEVNLSLFCLCAMHLEDDNLVNCAPYGVHRCCQTRF